jgi:hypothetical protein
VSGQINSSASSLATPPLAAVEQEGEQGLGLARAGLLASPALDLLVAAFHPKRAEGEHVEAMRRRRSSQQGHVQCGRDGMQGSPLFCQVAQGLGLLILALASSQGGRDVAGREAHQLLVVRAEGRARPGGTQAQLANVLALGGQCHDRTVRPVRQLRPVRRDDRAFGPHDHAARQVEGSSEPGQGRLHACIGGMGRERRLAKRSQEALASDRPRRSVPESGSQPPGGRFVQRDRHHEGKCRQEGQVQAQEVAARGVDGDEGADEQEQAQPECNRGPECPAGHLRREEDTGREDRGRRESHRQGDQGDPDPWVRVAHDGQESHRPADGGHHDRRERDPELSAAGIGLRRSTEGLEQPGGPDR